VTWLDTTLNRLRRHFRHVDAEKPASTDSLKALVADVPDVPEDLLNFFRRTNGVGVHLNDSVVGQVFSVEEARSAFSLALDSHVARRLLPIRADGYGNYDCVVVGPGLAQGAVVFWDHEVYAGPAYLLAGSFASFFQMWADHVIEVYLRDGREDPRYIAPRLNKWPWVGEAERTHPWPFDEEWMKAVDPRAAMLLGDAATRKWLLSQDQ
jgi:hypothetical protein